MCLQAQANAYRIMEGTHALIFVCIAMVANAIHESNLQPGIAGDCGSYGERKRDRSINIESKGLCCSYGLWQYNICTRTSMGTKYLKHYGLQNGTDQEKLEILTDAKKQIEYMIYYLRANYSGEISSEKSVEAVSYTHLTLPTTPYV